MPAQEKKTAKKQDAEILRADSRLEELRLRVRRLENVKTVVTVRTRPGKS